MVGRLYSTTFALLLPWLALRLLWRGIRDRRHWDRWHERFGFFRGSLDDVPRLWVHAVSVGESVAATRLVHALRAAYDGHEIVMTTTTITGAEVVARTLSEQVRHVYFPYDLNWIVGRFLRRFRPRTLIILETELWPNTIDCCKRAGVPVVLVNARLSERSMRGYQSVPAMSRAMIRDIDAIAAQGATDADRFLKLGARNHQLTVTGSLKFDHLPAASVREQGEVLRREFGMNRLVFMLASTRDGEEALLLDGINALHEEFPGLLTLVAPRHPERFEAVADLFRNAGHRVVTLSSGARCSDEVSVFLIDTLGDLPRFYAAADLAFVGGSVLPFGGHNVLEPASLALPVMCGPHTENFEEICQLLERHGGLQRVGDAADFAAAAARWLRDSNERDRVGQAGLRVVLDNRGATERTVGIIRRVLKS